MTDAELDLQGCEHCSEEFPIEEMTMMADCWFCPRCMASWQKHFADCEHQWEPHNLDGEDGRYCAKCCGFVANGGIHIVETTNSN